MWHAGMLSGDYTAFLAQLAGVAAPLTGGLSRAHLAELLRRSGARVLVAAGPELAPDVHTLSSATSNGRYTSPACACCATPSTCSAASNSAG